MPNITSQPPVRSAPGDRTDNGPGVSNEAQAKNFFISSTSSNAEDLNEDFFQTDSPSMSGQNQSRHLPFSRYRHLG